jgi:hypothetical protein
MTVPFYLRGKIPSAHWMGSWVGSKASVDDVEKNSWTYQDSNPNPLVIQAVASYYTNCAIPAPTSMVTP